MAPLCLYFYIHISSLVFKIFWSYSRCIFINKNFQQKGKQNRAGECMKPYTALLNSPPKSTTYMWNMCTTHDFLILISIRTHICSSAWIPNPKEYVIPPIHPSITQPTHLLSLSLIVRRIFIRFVTPSWISTCISFGSLQILVQRFRTIVYQLHQREVATILQPSHVCFGTRRIQEGRYWLGLHWFRYGLVGLYWFDWKGLFPPIYKKKLKKSI